jgi:hypothetical protein
MHVPIVSNLIGAFVNATVDGPWIVLRSSMKIYAPVGDSDVYPDVSVVCGQPEFVGEGTDVIANPAVIIEVGRSRIAIRRMTFHAWPRLRAGPSGAPGIPFRWERFVAGLPRPGVRVRLHRRRDHRTSVRAKGGGLDVDRQPTPKNLQTPTKGCSAIGGSKL